MQFQEILNELSAIANPQKAHQMKAYMKNQFEFLGVPAPERRAVQKVFFKAEKSKEIDWDFVEKCWASDFRELQYTACDYLKSKGEQLSVADLPKLKSLIERKSWWDSVDDLAHIVGELVFNFTDLEEVMIQWSVEENFWLRRVAIIHQLLRKEKTNLPLLEQILKNNFGEKEFFINKAIGWALRDLAKTNARWVKNFVENHRPLMANLSIREALKHL